MHSVDVLIQLSLGVVAGFTLLPGNGVLLIARERLNSKMYLGYVGLKRTLFSKPFFAIIVSSTGKPFLLLMSLLVFSQALRSRERFLASIFPATYKFPHTTMCDGYVSREVVVSTKCFVAAFLGTSKWSLASVAAFVLGQSTGARK
jgi:hypothetical protein